MNEKEKAQVAKMLRSLATELEGGFLQNAEVCIESQPKIAGMDGPFLVFADKPEFTSVSLSWAGGFPCSQPD